MPRVIFKPEGGVPFEADLSFDELKELVTATQNGHVPIAERPKPQQQVARRAGKRSYVRQVPDIDGFLDHLQDRARKFLAIMHAHPKGIEAKDLTPMLGFTKPAQIGGLTGPGITKVAKEYGIRASDIYKSEIIFPGGVRKRMFYPGKMINQFVRTAEETPLFKRGA